MEFVEGKTLYDDLSNGKIFNETEAIDLILQLVAALGHAHSLGLIHRDVKPANLMLDEDGRIVELFVLPDLVETEVNIGCPPD